MSVCETSSNRSSEIKARLAAIQAELDAIGPTTGMQQRRAQLRREKDALLDELSFLRSCTIPALGQRLTEQRP